MRSKTSRRAVTFVLTVMAASTAFGPVAVARAATPFSPAGLSLEHLRTDPAAPGTLYLGLFRSSNEGRTWSWSGRGLEDETVEAVAFDPYRQGTLYALGGGGFAAKLFRTTDGGATWRLLSSFPLEDVSPLGRDLAIDRSGTIYAAIGHVFASVDPGGTWTVHRDFGAPIQSVVIDSTTSGTLYLATSSMGGAVAIPARLHKTQDGGRTWEDISHDVLPTELGYRMGFGTVHLAITASRQPTVYAGVSTQGIFRSTDGGASWVQLPVGEPFESMELRALALGSGEPAALYAAYAEGIGAGHVLVSQNGGTTWRNHDEGLTARGPWELAVDSNGVVFAADLYGGLQSSSQGGRWQTLIRTSWGGGVPSFTGKVRFLPGDPSTVFTLLAGRAWKSVNGGRTWTAFATSEMSPLLNDLAFDAQAPDVVYGASQSGVFRGTDAGTRWTKLRGATADVLLVPQPGTIIAGGCGIARSTDGGNSWREVLACDGSSPGDRREIERLNIDAAAPNQVVATVRPFLGKRSVYRSLDGGATWRPLSGVNALTRDPFRPRTLYAGMGNEIAKSTDGGRTWSSITARGGFGEISDLTFDPTKPGTLYVTDFSGLLRSGDGGRTWAPVTPAFSAFGVTALSPHPSVPHLFYVVASNRFYEVRLEP